VIVQVDRVASAKEAIAFRDAGVDLIGVEVGSDRRFTDARFVSADVVEAIRQQAAPIRLVGLVEGCFQDATLAESRDRLERTLALRPDFLQIWQGDFPDELKPLVQASGVPVIGDGAGLDAEHGTFIDPNDPARFVIDSLSDVADMAPTLFHLDVATDREDPWAFLTGEALEWREESLQVSHVAAATKALPLLLSLMGLSATTIVPYVQAFPDARGFFARLGPGDREGPPTISPEPLLAALRAWQGMRRGGGTRPAAASPIVAR
jgi:hypothetical protein